MSCFALEANPQARGAGQLSADPCFEGRRSMIVGNLWDDLVFFSLAAVSGRRLNGRRPRVRWGPALGAARTMVSPTFCVGRRTEVSHPLQGAQNMGTPSSRLLIIEDRVALPGNPPKRSGYG
jgi:hypothetical protein